MEQPLQSSAGNGNTLAHTRYRIEDRSYLNLIKKEVGKAAESIGFSHERIGRLNIILSELVSNLSKHGLRKRELLWKPIFLRGETGIEIISIDTGPGITNTRLALQDGYSTSGTAGEGLGAIKRLSDTFELYSQPDKGTIVLCRMFARELPERFDQSVTVTAISVAKPGEQLCGDGFYIKYKPEEKTFKLLVLDGLGHGPEAYKAAQNGIEAFINAPQNDQSHILKYMHPLIKNTRGAVGMALELNFEQEMLRYCGIGNISGRLLSHDAIGTKSLASSNGIIGHVISSRINDQEVMWEKGKLLVLHSDGLTARWDLSKNQQILKYDPAVIGALLYRDYNRGNDDATVIVSKYPM